MTHSSQPETIRPRRSFIFTPGLKPEMFPKALASGADMVCIELEDGVAPKDKDEARRKGLSLFEKPLKADGVECVVRINCMRSAFGISDIQAILKSSTPPPGGWSRTLQDGLNIADPKCTAHAVDADHTFHTICFQGFFEQREAFSSCFVLVFRGNSVLQFDTDHICTRSQSFRKHFRLETRCENKTPPRADGLRL